jgi:hypothetical protein
LALPANGVSNVTFSLQGFSTFKRDGIELTVGQGAKPGTGGMLLGSKISSEIAAARELPPGVDQRSPARHPDWLGPDDLSLKIQEIREATDYQVPIQLKLGAARVYDDVRMAAKCGPDIIYLDGAEGGTGAGPHIATEETGILAQARAAIRLRAFHVLLRRDSLIPFAAWQRIGFPASRATVTSCCARARSMKTSPSICPRRIADFRIWRLCTTHCARSF